MGMLPVLVPVLAPLPNSYQSDAYEALKISETFSPVLQYFYQCLIHRAFNDDTQLPPLDPLIANYVRPDKKLFDKVKMYIDNLAKQFPLKEQEVKEEKEKVFWRNVYEQEAKNVEDKMVVEEEQKAEKTDGDKEKFITFEDEERVRNISTNKPVQDFKKMINDKKEDLASSAVTQMVELIKNLIKQSFQGNQYDKAIECLEELRKGCIQEDEVPAFNDFLRELQRDFSKGKYGPFWDKVVFFASLELTCITKVVLNAITLISKRENKKSAVEEDEANKVDTYHLSHTKILI